MASDRRLLAEQCKAATLAPGGSACREQIRDQQVGPIDVAFRQAELTPRRRRRPWSRAA